MSRSLNEVYIQAATDKAVELRLTEADIDSRMTELRQAGLQAVASEVLRRAAEWFAEKQAAYGSHTVASILREMAVSETKGEEQRR